MILNDTQNVGYQLNQFKQYMDEKKTSAFQPWLFDLDLKKLLLEILKCAEDTHSTLNSNIYVRKGVSFITSNFNRDIEVETVAEYLRISKVHLQKLFRENLGTSVYEEINRIRIEKSKEYIANTNLALHAIAKNCGYNSDQVFIKNFKKYVGVTPTEFKKQEQHRDHFSMFILNKGYTQTKW